MLAVSNLANKAFWPGVESVSTIIADQNPLLSSSESIFPHQLATPEPAAASPSIIASRIAASITQYSTAVVPSESFKNVLTGFLCCIENRLNKFSLRFIDDRSLNYGRQIDVAKYAVISRLAGPTIPTLR